MSFLTFQLQGDHLDFGLFGFLQLVCVTLVPCGAVFGHIAHIERYGNGVSVHPQVGYVGGDSFIPGVQPPQACVEVTGRPTGQGDVVSLYGCLRFNGDFLRFI